MNIRCPHCQTVFRVNPERIPPAGVRARCARCGDSFMVTPPAPTAGASPGQPATHGQSSAAPPSPPSPTAPGFGAYPPPTQSTPVQTTYPSDPPPSGRQAGPTSVPAPTAPSAQPRPSPVSPGSLGDKADRPSESRPSAASPAAATATRSPFGQRDPSERAHRIARALVSDIVAYHPERRDQSLEAGTLRAEFRDEIMKSWEEYVAQVGQPLAKSTPFFRDALNAILAKGQKLF